MKNRWGLVFFALIVAFTLSACAQTGGVDVAALQSELDEIKAQNEKLQSDNQLLQQKVDTLQAQIDDAIESEIVQSGDVTVLLSGKSTSTGRFSEQYANFVFSVTNHTDKEIKGVQGTANFKDIFGVLILPLNCDFTGTTIEVGETVQIDDLSLDCNQFMDDHMKLYNTALEDLTFEYEVHTIVFADGTTKTEK